MAPRERDEAGTARPRRGRAGAGVDAFNERAREAWRSVSSDAVRAEAEAARAAFRATVAALPPGALDPADAMAAFIVRANGAAHYDEHRDDSAPRVA